MNDELSTIAKPKHMPWLWVTRKNHAWISEMTGMPEGMVDELYREARKKGITCTIYQKEITKMKLVIIESPYAGDIELNLKYCRAAMADSLRRGEAPYASHALYTQLGVLDDTVPSERALGIEAGLSWGRVADLVAFYTDLGWSSGMVFGKRRAENRRAEIVERTIPGWTE